MKELELKYGCNPNQKPSRIFMWEGELPIEVLNGKPGYINFLDALNSYQLVRELRAAAGLPSAASFKHVSPAGAAVGIELSDTEREIYFAPAGELSPLACAYIRARGADRVSSYGDWAALSDICDESTALALLPEVSDGVIAPGYAPEALAILRRKRSGNYPIIRIEEGYVPKQSERRDVYGVTFEQGRNNVDAASLLPGKIVTRRGDLGESAMRDLTVALVTLKYTQSNSVAYSKDGGVIGVGAGQQSRIQCTRLAGDKADKWWLRSHEKVRGLPFRKDVGRPARDNAVDVFISGEEDEVGYMTQRWTELFTSRPEPLTQDERRGWAAALTGVSLGSDAFFPFGDNIARAARSGVSYIAQPGGSMRDGDVVAACDERGVVMTFTGARLFHH
jgi:phosphoribosylaminoimidazolecarboxamide formyltransferase/IMP cyclohydrolase/phosphoribosylaminoimidazolecarboxamide formyltransferase